MSLPALLFAALAVPAAVARTGALYDADAHLLTASGAAAADLRAPTATIARVKAERQARTTAEKKLIAALVELGDAADLEGLDKQVADAKVGDVRYGSDGSVQLTLTLATDELPLKRAGKRRKGKSEYR